MRELYLLIAYYKQQIDLPQKKIQYSVIYKILYEINFLSASLCYSSKQMVPYFRGHII